MKSSVKIFLRTIVFAAAAIVAMSGLLGLPGLPRLPWHIEAADVYGAERGNEISVIFTHDMHSHMDTDRKIKDGKIVNVGGFAKLKAAMDEAERKNPGSFIVDAGDFSMGTPYQTIFSEEAAELKMMKYLGYEAVTFGNHEFDYRALGLASMLNEAEGEGPGIVASNIDWRGTLDDENLKKDASVLKEACDDYGVRDYIVINHENAKIAIFGLMGKTAVEYAPESGLLFEDAAKRAAETVEKIKSEEDVDMIVCLSHCGTVENEEDKIEESEDYMLAGEVPDIDLIISGHSHTVLPEAVQVGDTYIVSCGSYNANMGHIVLKRDGSRYTLESYELVPLDESIRGDEGVNRELSKYRNLADKEYFDDYGYRQEQVIAENDIDFTPIEKFGLVQGEETLGNLIADSYKYAVARADEGNAGSNPPGENKNKQRENSETGAEKTALNETEAAGNIPDVTVVPSGVIRSSLLKGDVTVADAFNILSLGYGKDGSSGYPLVRIYLTGRELRDAAEVDASISNFMGVARLYSSGLEYSWNDSRLILNRAVDIKFNDGTGKTELEDDRLYSIVADLYSCQMLGSVKAKSFGLLKIDPKDAFGRPITDFEKHIIYDNGRELKAWFALASYIDSFEGGKIPEYYGSVQGRKTESHSKNPIELLKQPNKIALIIWAAAAVLIILIIAAFVLVRKHRRKKKSAVT